MTVVEALTWANNKLKDHAIDAPMLDAQLLLASVLNVSKNYLFTHFAQELDEEQLTKFEALIERRRHHDPLAYIVGWQEFYKRPFSINNFVLIPRPDTETLIDEAIALAKDARDTVFLDIGTGSGAIAITLTLETSLPVIATDISSHALVVAKQNARINQAEDRLTFLNGSLIDPITPEMIMGLNEVIICANLPYLATRQWSQTQPEVHDYEPRLALDGGIDGLDIYHELFHSLAMRRADFPKKLTTLIEIDPDQVRSAPQLIAQHFPNAVSRVVEDLTHQPRVIVSTI